MSEDAMWREMERGALVRLRRVLVLHATSDELETLDMLLARGDRVERLMAKVQHLDALLESAGNLCARSPLCVPLMWAASIQDA